MAWELLAVQIATWALYACSVGSDPGYVPLQGADIESSESCALTAGWPPLRTRFCKEAGAWVAKYDHWCPLLNTPIGERNHCRQCCVRVGSVSGLVQVLVALLAPDFKYTCGATGLVRG